MSYTQHCQECPLKGKGDPFDGKGSANARFVVVIDTPSHRPESYGKLMQSSAMNLFGKCMLDEQFDKSDFFFVPQVRCPHDPDIYSTKEKRLIKKCCRPHLVEQIKKRKPEAVLPLGAEAASQTLGRAVKITKIRGVPDRTEEFGRTVVLPMLGPMMVVLYPQHEPVFRADCATLGRLVDNDYNITQSSRSVLGNYEMVDDLQFLVDERPEIIAYDTENTGLRWFASDAKILTMQFCTREGEAYLLPWDHPDNPQNGRAKARLKKQFIQLMCRDDVTIVGQNAKYDAVYTYGQLGVRYRIGGDTLMLAALYDENSRAKNLDDLVKRFVPAMAGYADRFNATVDKSRMIELPLNQDFLDYGCGDADSTFRLYSKLMPEIAKDKKLLAHYEHVTIPGLNAFASVELRGLHVDEEYVDEFESFMAERVDGMRKSLLAQIPKSIKRKHLDIAQEKSKGKPVSAEEALKFSKKDFLLDVLFHHKDGYRLKPKVFTKTTARLDTERRVPSLSTKDHLPYFYDTCPFTYELSEYIKSERILSTSVKGFKKKYIVDGMVRPVYNLHVAVTGRTSSEDPNGQNFPKRGPIAMAYRQLFVAPEGYFVLEADLSQAELRIAADMANDRTMIGIYRSGGDIHVATALIALGVTEEQFYKLDKSIQKDARTKAKAINFGFLYGMGWRKFIAYAKTQYGVEFTEKEAQRIRVAFFEKYYMLPEWHAMMRKYAREHGFVRSYSGRIRHLPMITSEDEGIQSEAERQAINSPVQEFGSSLGVMACGRMNEELDPRYLSLVGFVHDALYAYVPKQYLEWGAKTMRYYMESNPLEEWFDRRMKLPIVADVGFGVNLGQVFEMGSFDGSDDGEVSVGDYNFDELWEKEPESGLVVPRQRIPSNNGRLRGSIYTQCAY